MSLVTCGTQQITMLVQQGCTPLQMPYAYYQNCVLLSTVLSVLWCNSSLQEEILSDYLLTHIIFAGKWKKLQRNKCSRRKASQPTAWWCIVIMYKLLPTDVTASSVSALHSDRILQFCLNKPQNIRKLCSCKFCHISARIFLIGMWHLQIIWWILCEMFSFRCQVLTLKFHSCSFVFRD